MKQIFALWMARNREYYRDKGSLFWSFIATPLIVIILALAFSAESNNIFRVGVFSSQGAIADTSKLISPLSPRIFSDEPTVEVIEYKNLKDAIRKIQLHKLDILIDSVRADRYWINPESEKGLYKK